MLPAHIEQVLRVVVPRIPVGTQWALSCGSALALHGLEHRPSDVDLFAVKTDGALLAAALSDLDVEFPYAERLSAHIRCHWGRFVCGGIEIDVVGDFAVEREGHSTVWDIHHPCWHRLNHVAVHDVLVPVFSLEDLLALYKALDEVQKVTLIQASLRHGIRT